MAERNGYLPGISPDDSSSPGISRAQLLHLELIRLASFNAFDGERVAADLAAHRELWQAVIMGNFISGNHLYALRDLPDGHNNVDTLMLLTRREKRHPLERLASRWQAQSVRWLTDREASHELGVSPVGDRWVLEVWWD